MSNERKPQHQPEAAPPPHDPHARLCPEHMLPDFRLAPPNELLVLPVSPEQQRPLRLGAQIGLRIGRRKIAKLLVDGHRPRTGSDPVPGSLSLFPSLEIDDQGALFEGDPFLMGMLAGALDWGELPDLESEPTSTKYQLATMHLGAVMMVFGLGYRKAPGHDHAYCIVSDDVKKLESKLEALRGHLESAMDMHEAKLSRCVLEGGRLQVEVVARPRPK